MAYSHVNSKGVTYYLFTSNNPLKPGGKPTRRYFFSKSPTNDKGEACDLPENGKVVENPRNGFVALSKKDKTKSL